MFNNLDRVFLLALCAVALNAGSTPAIAKASYTEVEIAGARTMEIDFINNAGAVAGHYDGDGALPAFIVAPNGTVTKFSAPGALSTTPTGFNDSGAVGGVYEFPSDEEHAFYRDPAGVLTSFDPPAAGHQYQLGGMNAKGDIVGSYADNQQGFIRHADGTFKTFSLPGAVVQGVFLIAINDRGDVAGSLLDSSGISHGFIRTHRGAITLFDAPCAGTTDLSTVPVAINNKGWVAGNCASIDSTKGFVRKPDGTMDVIDLGDKRFTAVGGINSKGDVVGSYGAHFRSHGFLQTAHGKIRTFDVPFVANGFTTPAAINNAGVVAGSFVGPEQSSLPEGFVRTP